MNKEEKIKISVNEEDIQNLINCYKEDIEYIMQLEKENKQLKERINKAIEYIEYNNETLYTYEPDYDYEENMVDNYDISNYREDLLKILKGVE